MLERFWNGKARGILGACVVVLRRTISISINYIKNKCICHNFNKCGSNVKISEGLIYRYPSLITLKNNIIIGSNNSFTSESNSDAYLFIESDVSIGESCSIDFTGGIILRESCHIAQRVVINTHTHGYDYKSKPIGKKLEIGRNAFVGMDSIILYNVDRIGENSVIGAGSVVTKDVPNNVVVGGNPAVILKYIK